MSKLAVLSLALVVLPCAALSQLPVEHLPDLPALDIQQFDPAEHLCKSYQRGLQTYEDAYLWLEYIRALNVGETSIDLSQCNGTLLSSIRRSVLSEQIDDAAALSGIIAIWGGTFHRGVADTVTPEGRYANDAEALGLLSLACRRFAPEEMFDCISSVVQYDYNGYVESSPIFCDFSQQENYSSELKETYAEVRAIIETIPSTCSGLLSDPDGPAEQQQDDWWLRVSNALMINLDFRD